MPYTVILPTGKIMQFYIRSLAETYASMYRGTLVTTDSLTTPELLV